MPARSPKTARPTAGSRLADRAVFLDRDGTLIRDAHHDFHPDRIELLSGVVEGLRLLQAAGFPLCVVTNQSGVARGHFAESAVHAMHGRLDELLRAHGVRLASYHYCPHHPEGIVPRYARTCGCRKPRPGLLRQASAATGVAPARCWLIGDAPTDVLAGQSAGCRTILLAPDGVAPPGLAPTHVARSLLEAARLIVAAPQRRQQGRQQEWQP